MATRSLVLPFGPWWLEAARAKVKSDPRGDVGLAEQFHRELNTTVEGARSYLNKFKNEKAGATLTLARALCREYAELPYPVLFFESKDEALEVMSFASRLRAGGKRSIEPPAPPPPPPAPTRRKRQRQLKGSAREEFEALREKSRPQK